MSRAAFSSFPPTVPAAVAGDTNNPLNTSFFLPRGAAPTETPERTTPAPSTVPERDTPAQPTPFTPSEPDREGEPRPNPQEPFPMCGGVTR